MTWLLPEQVFVNKTKTYIGYLSLIIPDYAKYQQAGQQGADRHRNQSRPDDIRVISTFDAFLGLFCRIVGVVCDSRALRNVERADVGTSDAQREGMRLKRA